MSKILRISQNNYRVQVQSGGTITLDTGEATGTVYITGDLIVQGNQTTLNTTNLDVEDNLVRLNVGETGVGITEGTSGLEIVRGSLSDALFLFDESVPHYSQPDLDNVDGTFVIKTADGTLSGIQVGTITSGLTSNISFDLQNSNNVLEIVNADEASYSARVTAGDGNVIPNKKYLEDFVSSGIVVVGQADVDRIYKGSGSPVTINAEVLANQSNIQFFIRSSGSLNQRAIITSSGLTVDDINLFEHTITSAGTYNLVLTSSATNEVEINSILTIDQNPSGSTLPTGGKTKIYTNSVAGPGNSGIFFANNTASDELVSKNRAVLLSILL
jgi:hypothetical protein